MGALPLAASAVEGLGVLAYAGLVYVVLRTASRWADRALEPADRPASPSSAAPSSSKGERA